MIRTQVYIPDDLYHEAKLTAHLQGTNISTIIRQGLKQVLGQPKEHEEGYGEEFFGALKYGPKDLSTRINEIYE